MTLSGPNRPKPHQFVHFVLPFVGLSW